MSVGRDFTGSFSYNPNSLTPEELTAVFSEMVVALETKAAQAGYKLDWGGLSLEQNVEEDGPYTMAEQWQGITHKYGFLNIEVRGVKIDE